MSPTPVIHDQDGHADDLVATLLLAAHPAVDLKAVVVNSGDAIPEVSAKVLAEVLDQLGHPPVALAYELYTLPHPFPEAWQRESINYLNAYPQANRRSVARAGPETLIRAIQASTEPVTLLGTGPLSNLAAALRQAPEIARNLARVVLMAGGLEAGGNVDPHAHAQPNHDGSAEWNLYCDPAAAAFCLAQALPLELVTLDVTNAVPMTPRFIQELKATPGAPAQTAATLLQGVNQQDYYFWDSLAALLTCEPDFLPRESLCVNLRTDAPAEGRLEASADGVPVQVYRPGPAAASLGARVEAQILALLGNSGTHS